MRRLQIISEHISGHIAAGLDVEGCGAKREEEDDVVVVSGWRTGFGKVEKGRRDMRFLGHLKKRGDRFYR